MIDLRGTLLAMTFHIITLFPESFNSYLESSIIGRAIREKKIKLRFYNPVNFVSPAKLKRGRPARHFVDGRPYGGGPGMVMEALPILKAVSAAQTVCRRSLTVSKGNSRLASKACPAKIIIFSPAGKQFTNQLARQWEKKYEHLILICGHYEGIDARVKKILRAEEISVGPFVLTGGELPAMIVLDAVARQTGGVLGKIESLEEDRIASSEVYTRPEILKYKNKNYRVPKVLLSGHHAEIENWKRKSNSKSVDN